MRVSKAQAEANRARIIETAGRLFREKGFDGIGVADLMKEAGLTHGGFYGHFASKEDLAAAATAQAFAEMRAYLEKTVVRYPEDAFERVVRAYLSEAHRAAPGRGCVAAALGPEAGRHAPPVQAAMTAGIEALLALLARIAPGKTEAARETKALSALTEMLGAMVLARSVGDPGLAAKILKAAEARILGG